MGPYRKGKAAPRALGNVWRWIFVSRYFRRPLPFIAGEAHRGEPHGNRGRHLRALLPGPPIHARPPKGEHKAGVGTLIELKQTIGGPSASYVSAS